MDGDHENDEKNAVLLYTRTGGGGARNEHENDEQNAVLLHTGTGGGGARNEHEDDEQNAVLLYTGTGGGGARNEHENDEQNAVLLYTRTGGGGARNKQLLTLMPHPILKSSLEVRHMCHFLFYVAPDQVWISDGSNLILADPGGAISYHLRDILQQIYQVHTVASDGTLFYISNEFRINKLSKDQQEGIPLITLEETWEPLSVLCSPITGDLLVGTHKSHTDKRKSKGKITRYNSNGQQVQTIQYDNNGEFLYSYPGYLSKNRNGDIIVSDWHRVVVTNCKGEHRFSYRGHSGPRISPRGNCTDTLSNILVCDLKTTSVHMLDKDGHFLSYLLREGENMVEPHTLSYDERNNLLWIGSFNSTKLRVFKYIDSNQQDEGVSGPSENGRKKDK